MWLLHVRDDADLWMEEVVRDICFHMFHGSCAQHPLSQRHWPVHVDMLRRWASSTGLALGVSPRCHMRLEGLQKDRENVLQQRLRLHAGQASGILIPRVWNLSELTNVHQLLQDFVLLVQSQVDSAEHSVPLMPQRHDLAAREAGATPEELVRQNNDIVYSAHVIHGAESTQDEVFDLEGRLTTEELLPLCAQHAKGEVDQVCSRIRLRLGVRRSGEEQVPKPENRRCRHIGSEEAHEGTIEDSRQLESNGIELLPEFEVVVSDAALKQHDIMHGPTCDAELRQIS
mmetsp:Transcript_37101/g.81459  ORF Transcript_37101/g.81459 Transcript_37101/m.81459 type:complete len:286 (-) Transcript_37101:436-1293(-)